jgi:hypothetical protein
MRTLLNQWPEPRSTNDLDLFLRPELLIESSKLKLLVSAIAELGYEVVPGAKNTSLLNLDLAVLMWVALRLIS